jgi:hypothetical protein
MEVPVFGGRFTAYVLVRNLLEAAHSIIAIVLGPDLSIVGVFDPPVSILNQSRARGTF